MTLPSSMSWPRHDATSLVTLVCAHKGEGACGGLCACAVGRAGCRERARRTWCRRAPHRAAKRALRTTSSGVMSASRTTISMEPGSHAPNRSAASDWGRAACTGRARAVGPGWSSDNPVHTCPPPPPAHGTGARRACCRLPAPRLTVAALVAQRLLGLPQHLVCRQQHIDALSGSWATLQLAVEQRRHRLEALPVHVREGGGGLPRDVAGG